MAEPTAAPMTITGKGSLSISAVMATPSPTTLWSIMIRVLLVKEFTATNAVSKTMGIKRLMRSARGWLSHFAGTLAPAYLSAKAKMLVPSTAIH